MPVRHVVVFVAIAVEVVGQSGHLLGGQSAHITHILGSFARCFFGTRSRGIGQTLLNLVDLPIEKTVTANQASVEQA